MRKSLHAVCAGFLGGLLALSLPIAQAGFGGAQGGNAASANLSAISALTPTDNGAIVGNGTAFVVESGATLKTSLGLTIGTDVQAFDQQLADVAALAYASNGSKVVRVNAGATAFELATLGAGDVESLHVTDQATGVSITYTVPGGTLGTNNDYLEFWASGVWSTNTGDAVRVRFGGTQIFTMTPPAASHEFVLHGHILRLTATTQACSTLVSPGGGNAGGGSAQGADARATAAIDLSQNADLVVDFAASAGTGELIHHLIVKKVAAP